MIVGLTGSHGFLGTALTQHLEASGHTVVPLARRPGPSWDLAPLEDGGNVTAVIHLAGEGIASHRWRPSHKTAVMQSRADGTRWLASALAALAHPPSTLISASAVGFYGDRGDEILTEDSSSGTGFLAEVCRRWEESTAPAAAAGIRVVTIRTGIVLSSGGGALPRQLPLFKLGMGGRLGRGTQYMSWIAREDHVAAVAHCLLNDAVQGPVNVVGPEPVTNAAFTRALGRAVRRPAFFAVPAPVLRLVLGAEFASELLLASQRVLPAALQASGFQFRHPALDDALRLAVTGAG